MNLESDKRLNIQLRLDFSSAPTGEARQAGREDIESLSAVHEPERPANTCSKRVSATSRTAVYGAVRTVVWEGRSCEAPPYPDRSDFVLWPEAACFGPRPPPLAVASRIGRVWAPPALMPPSSGSQPLTQLGRLPHSNSMDAKGSSAGRLDCAASVRDSGIE